MAQLAFGIAGGIVGGFFGAPNLGFVLGSALGSALFPGPDQVSQGPRLGDLRASNSSYGIPINLGYGTIRMPGNLIWAGTVREVENRSEQGGKGGPSQVSVTYTYFVNCAFAFSAREASDVLRIWFDNDLVYDKRSSTAPTTGTFIGNVIRPGLSFTFYPGSETQLPDPVMESEEGVGQVPAFRGLSYIVFNDLNLSEHGTRFPQVTVELTFNRSETNSDRFSDDITVGEGSIFTDKSDGSFAVDHKRRLIYMLGTTGTTENGLRVYNMDTLVEQRQKYTSDMLSSSQPYLSNFNELHVGDSGYIYSMIGNTSNCRPIVKIDPNTLTEVARYGTFSIFDDPAPGGRFWSIDRATEITAIALSPLAGRRNYLIVRPIINNSFGILISEDMSFLYYSDSSGGAIRGIAPGAPRIGVATGWIARQNGTGNVAIDIHKIEISTLAEILEDESTSGVTETVVDTLDPSEWNNDAAGSAAVGPIFDETDGGLIFLIPKSGGGSYVLKWREDDGVVWLTTVDPAPPASTQSITGSSKLSEGLFGFLDTFGEACLIDTSDGTVIVNGFDWDSISPSTNPTGVQVFKGTTQSIISNINNAAYGNLGELFLNRVDGQGELLSTIVSDVSTRVGLTPASDLDVTELTDTVRGYAITRQMSGREAIEPLQQLFLFDGVESDNKVFFKTRGRDPDRTINDTDLIPLDDQTGDAVKETRTQEVELPNRLSLVYMDIDRDYTEGTQAAKRVLSPYPAVQTRNEVSIAAPIVLNANEAAQAVERILYVTWSERVAHQWRTPWEHMDLDPADVVQLSLNDGMVTNTLRARIIQALINGDLSVSFESIAEDKVTVESVAVGDTGDFPQQAIPGPAFTQTFLLDVPLLRDVDDTGGTASRLYFAMNGFNPLDWPGAVLYFSSDGAVFGSTGVVANTGVSFGYVANKLPTTTTPFQTDLTTVLSVYMVSGSLSSVTESEFLTNVNAALVGSPTLQNWELILFKDAVVQSDGTYDVSTILRARRGTDPQVDTHVNGEVFILLDATTIQSYLLGLSALNATRYYKGVGRGQIPEDADILALASTMADLKPYAPAQLAAVVDGGNNIDLDWERRTRIGGDLVDGTGNVPLAEESEAYEVDILDSPGGTVLRTLTSSTTSVQYDNADIVTDFGSVPSSLSFTVYQISAAVGRGYGTEATIVF